MHAHVPVGDFWTSSNQSTSYWWSTSESRTIFKAPLSYCAGKKTVSEYSLESVSYKLVELHTIPGQSLLTTLEYLYKLLVQV